MAKTISFHLQKGGVGKTTISGTIAAESALYGKKTLAIDCDPQGNLSSWFLKESSPFEVADVLQGRCYVENAIVHVPGVDNFDILPTFGIGGTLKNYSETKLAEEPYVIQDLVKEVSSVYDHIVMDLSPGLGRLEKASLIASDEIVTPMTAEVFSLDGLEIFIEELKKLKKNMRSGVRHNKVVINSYDSRISQHREIYEAAKESGKLRVFLIPVDPLFRKAQEAHSIPQKFKSGGRGMKKATEEAIGDLYNSIWR